MRYAPRSRVRAGAMRNEHVSASKGAYRARTSAAMPDHTKDYPTRGDLAREQLRRRGVRYWGDVLEDIHHRLGKLAPKGRAAFAAACAEHLVRAHEQLGEDEQREMTLGCRDLVDAIWARLGLPLNANPATDAALSEFEADAYNEDDPPDEAHLATLYAAQ